LKSKGAEFTWWKEKEAVHKTVTKRERIKLGPQKG